MKYIRNMARTWLHRHPYLYALYKQSKFRLVTSPWRTWPDFVIIGAQKSGTTSLYDFIVKHPAIESAAKKELHYFSWFYACGDKWYRSNFPTNLSSSRFYKDVGQKLLTGEASPTYLFYPMVPGRMVKALPNVKLIVILRNPVDRAYSHYNHNIRHKHETLSFEKALEREKKMYTREWKQLVHDTNSPPIITIIRILLGVSM